MAKGYWISLYTKIENQENHAKTVTPIIKSYGGIPLVRGGKLVYDGDNCPLNTMKKQSNVMPRNIRLVGLKKLV